MPPWTVFLLSAAVVVLAGVRLARDGDTIATRTGLGGAWVGAVLVATATSLPELFTSSFAVSQGHVSLAVGDLFGASMLNMFVLGLADLFTRQVRVLTRVAINQALVGVLAICLAATAAAGVLAGHQLTFLGLGWAPLLIAVIYLGGMRLLHVNRAGPPFSATPPIIAPRNGPGLERALASFGLSALVILVAARFLATSAADLADLLGVSSGFLGLALLGFVTALPEAAVTFSSVRAGAYDLAVGNLLGSNCVNMALLVPLDLIDGPGSVLARAEPSVLVGATFAILLVGLVLLDVLNKSDRRLWYLEPGPLFLILVYASGVLLTYLATL